MTKLTSTFLTSIVSIFGSAYSAQAVTWDVQAERLQQVSATLLDAQPLLSPHDEGLRAELRGVVSMLPKTNATVGGKSEQPPQSPAHLVPTLEVSYRSGALSQVGHPGLRLWAGNLPGSSGKAVGMKASCAQSLWGGAVSAGLDHQRFVDLRFDAGAQRATTDVTGGITSPEANDTFHVDSKLVFAALTLSPAAYPSLWGQFQVLERSVGSEFSIPSDGTTFVISDDSKIARGSAATQVSIGYHATSGIQLALGYLNVPQRVSMPRVLLSYSMYPTRPGTSFASNK